MGGSCLAAGSNQRSLLEPGDDGGNAPSWATPYAA
eukprot:COSAG01_NODE_23374_length_817_cov_9.643013_2_plen_34_part_01